LHEACHAQLRENTCADFGARPVTGQPVRLPDSIDDAVDEFR